MIQGAAQALVDPDVVAPAVLLIDDDVRLLRSIRRLIEPEGFTVYEAGDAEAVSRQLRHAPDLVLLDLQLGAVSGQDLIEQIRRACPEAEIVVMTGYASIDSAVACMRAGVFDYLEKPFGDRHRVIQTLRRALEHQSLRARNRELEGELHRRTALERIVTRSPSMRPIVQMICDLAENESNVLIEAESGTGKELIARAIHQTSVRREQAFIPVDCGALPEGIAEAELFGYESGAYTGAVRSAPGLFRTAHGGTLFLDEIGELPIALQSKLLRTLQEREVRPLGSSRPLAVDVRLVVATNRDLEKEVRQGNFRADLYYRLHVVAIRIPPLRDRREDIPLLALHFLELYQGRSPVEGFTPEAIEALMEHPWEGNVRELENTIEAALALARGGRLTVRDLGLDSLHRRPPLVSAPENIPLSLAAYEQRCIEEALRQAEGDPARAARLLGIGRSTLYRKLRHYGLRG